VKTLMKEAVGYGAASAVALAVDMTILWTLVHFLGWSYLTASAVSFLTGAVVAYELSVRLAFQEHRLQNRHAELASFVAIGALGLAVNAMVIFAVVRFAGLHFMIAKGVAAGFTFACNFAARRQFLFVRYDSAT
jgi:putative flippase GtrA